MMGALIQLGKSEITLNYIKDSLKIKSDIKIDYIAPANGLILNNIEFN
jgi:tRNA pseudouridine38-40 synthase